MQPTELIADLNRHLSGHLAAEVRTNAENERPVPLVVLDSMDIEDFVHHNTPLDHVVETKKTVSDERYYRFYYDLRLDYEVRAGDDVTAHQLHDDLRHELMLLRLDPGSLDGDVLDVTLRGGGLIGHTFVEAAETELNQSVVFRTFHQVLKDNYETIEQIQSDISLI